MTDGPPWICTVCPRCGSDTADLYMVITAQSSTLLLDGSATEMKEYCPPIVCRLGIQVLCWSVRNMRDRLQTRKCVYCGWTVTEKGARDVCHCVGILCGALSDRCCLWSILIMITERNISQYKPTDKYSRIESASNTEKIGDCCIV